MKKYLKSQFILDVKKEASLIKKHATGEEIDKLSFIKLRPTNYDECVYGQMTGNCRSERAIELIKKCCQRSIENLCPMERNTIEFQEIPPNVNGKTIDDDRVYKFLSALETYILMKGAKNKQLISYLKGETKTVKL